MYYPDELVEEIRSRNDIVDVIGSYVKLQRKGNSYFGLCPFHNEKSPSFSVTPNKQMYYCFGCGAGGNLFTFLMQYENYTFPEALKVLADRAGIQLPEQEMTAEDRKAQDRKTLLLQIHKDAAIFYVHQMKGNSGRIGYDYLKGRRLSDETIRKFGLGFAPKTRNALYQYLKQKGYTDDVLRESGLVTMDEKNGVYDKFWNRVMFPIMDANNRVIGFGGRVMGDAKPKYLNSPETKIFDKSRNLYGLNLAKNSRKPNLIICEGYVDVIAMHQAGFNQAVASLGTALTAQQCMLMKRYTDEVLITYDSDEAGTKAALRAIPLLKEAGLNTRVLRMDPYKDPDEFIKNLGAEAFQERIDQAINSFLFEVDVLARDYDMKDPARKTAFFQEVAARLLTFPEELERNNYIEAISRRYQVGYQQLKQMVDRRGGALSGTVPVQRPKQSTRPKEKEDACRSTQKLLLTWMISDEGFSRTIRKFLSVEEFSDPMCRAVAEMLYAQHDEGVSNPAAIISRFDDPEQQSQVAAMFNTSLKQVESRADTEKALAETIRRMKKDNLSRKMEELDPTDMMGLQSLIRQKSELEKMKIDML